MGDIMGDSMVGEEEGGFWCQVRGGRLDAASSSGQLEHDQRPSWSAGQLAEVQLSQLSQLGNAGLRIGWNNI